MKALITVFEDKQEALDALKGSDYRKVLIELHTYINMRLRECHPGRESREAYENVQRFLRENAPAETWSE